MTRRSLVLGGPLSGGAAHTHQEQQQFARFYRSLYPRVLRYFERRLRDRDIARELASATFARAYELRARIRGRSDEEVRAFAFALAASELSHHRRRGAVAAAAFERLPATRPAGTEEQLEFVEWQIDVRAAEPQLAAAVGALPPGAREALMLRVLDERPYAEIARALGCSEGAVRVRVARARARLAAQLAGPLDT